MRACCQGPWVPLWRACLFPFPPPLQALVHCIATTAQDLLSMGVRRLVVANIYPLQASVGLCVKMSGK